MEHRFSPRKESNSSVIVYQKKFGFIKATVKNISAYGMLVDTGRSILPKGAIVELAGPASWKLESKAGWPKAVIIHAKDGQTGLVLIANREKIIDFPSYFDRDRTEKV